MPDFTTMFELGRDCYLPCSLQTFLITQNYFCVVARALRPQPLLPPLARHQGLTKNRDGRGDDSISWVPLQSNTTKKSEQTNATRKKTRTSNWAFLAVFRAEPHLFSAGITIVGLLGAPVLSAPPLKTFTTPPCPSEQIPSSLVRQHQRVGDLVQPFVDTPLLLLTLIILLLLVIRAKTTLYATGSAEARLLGATLVGAPPPVGDVHHAVLLVLRAELGPSYCCWQHRSSAP